MTPVNAVKLRKTARTHKKKKESRNNLVERFVEDADKKNKTKNYSSSNVIGTNGDQFSEWNGNDGNDGSDLKGKGRR